MTKEIVEIVLQYLPQEFELDELIEPLIFIEKIREERTVSNEEVREIMEKWKK